jgi:hypothetical protein
MKWIKTFLAKQFTNENPIPVQADHNGEILLASCAWAIKGSVAR